MLGIKVPILLQIRTALFGMPKNTILCPQCMAAFAKRTLNVLDHYKIPGLPSQDSIARTEMFECWRCGHIEVRSFDEKGILEK